METNMHSLTKKNFSNNYYLLTAMLRGILVFCVSWRVLLSGVVLSITAK